MKSCTKIALCLPLFTFWGRVAAPWGVFKPLGGHGCGKLFLWGSRFILFRPADGCQVQKPHNWPLGGSSCRNDKLHGAAVFSRPGAAVGHMCHFLALLRVPLLWCCFSGLPCGNLAVVPMGNHWVVSVATLAVTLPLYCPHSLA